MGSRSPADGNYPDFNSVHKKRFASQHQEKKSTQQTNKLLIKEIYNINNGGSAENLGQRGVQKQRFRESDRTLHGSDRNRRHESRVVFEPKRGTGALYIETFFFFEAFFDRLHLSLSASLLFFFFLFLKRNCEGGACRAFYYVLSLVCACVCACDFFVSLFRALRSPGFKKKMRLEREKRRLLFFSFSSSSLFDRERRARTLLKIDESTDH